MLMDHHERGYAGEWALRWFIIMQVNHQYHRWKGLNQFPFPVPHRLQSPSECKRDWQYSIGLSGITTISAFATPFSVLAFVRSPQVT